MDRRREAMGEEVEEVGWGRVGEDFFEDGAEVSEGADGRVGRGGASIGCQQHGEA
ncbi:MAG: hypothetical protein H0U59_06335 [Gemmatimonadaceae bacterium]|nr:hypothetical protein [Gemmatimonadaceae bacterium]